MSPNLLLTWTAFAALCGYAISQDFDTSFLNKCSRSDPQLNACLKKKFNGFKPSLARGIPEIGLPPMEPLKIDALRIEKTERNFHFKGVFSDNVISGASNSTVKEVRCDLNKLRFDLGLYIPHIKFSARYEVNNNIFLYPWVSNGDGYAEFTDMKLIFKVYGKQITKNNEAYMSVEKMVVDFVLKDARFRVKDRVYQQLSEGLSVFLNQNANEMVQELRKPISQGLAKFFKKLLDTALVNLPMRLWLTD